MTEFGWWLVGNRAFGTHVACARSAKEARADVRERIAETFRNEGHSHNAARRGASGYRVFVIAGPITEAEARAAQNAADADNWGPAVRLRRKTHGRMRAVVLP